MRRLFGKRHGRKAKCCLAFLICFCMAGTSVPVMASEKNEQTDAIAEGVSYCTYEDGSWTTKNISNAASVTSSDTEWGVNDSGEHWYVVSGTVNISGYVTVTGNVHLILTDSCELTINGIRSGDNSSLTIYAQSKGGEMGRLTVQNPGNDNAGIVCHSFTMNGGNVSATGANGYVVRHLNAYFPYSGGDGIHADSIIVNGGILTAAGGAGVGASGEHSGAPAGYGIRGGSITISDAKLTGTGHYGIFSENGEIKINGAAVEAVGDNDSGSGMSAAGITITGNSKVTASGRNGINAGGTGGVQISSGVVTATGIRGQGISGAFSTTETGNAFIIASSISNNADTSDWKGIIFQSGSGKVYGNITVNRDLLAPEGSTLEIEQGVTLTIAEDAEYTNVSTLINRGTIEVKGTLTNDGYIRNQGSIRYSGTIKNNKLFYSNGSGMTSENGTFEGNEMTSPDNLGFLLDKKFFLKEEGGKKYYSNSNQEDSIWTEYTGEISFWGGGNDGCIEVVSGTHEIMFDNVVVGKGKYSCIDTGKDNSGNTVKLTLAGNNTIHGYIYVRNGTTFEITDRSTGCLNVIADGTDYNSAIGAGFKETPGTINIHGGSVVVEVLSAFALNSAIGPGQWGSAVNGR